MGLLVRLIRAFMAHDQEYDDRHQAILNAIAATERKIMTELDDRLTALNTTLAGVGDLLSGTIAPEITKIGGETANLLASLQALVDNPPGGISSAQSQLLNDAMDKANTISSSVSAIKDALQAIDDKVPDNPTP